MGAEIKGCKTQVRARLEQIFREVYVPDAHCQTGLPKAVLMMGFTPFKQVFGNLTDGVEVVPGKSRTLLYRRLETNSR